MAAYTDQIRRFIDEPDFQVPAALRRSPLPRVPLAETLQVLHTQIHALILDMSMSQREASCRKAEDSLAKMGRHMDINARTVGLLLKTQTFSPTRLSQVNRNRVSERLGAVAAWKWVDLCDELQKPQAAASATEVDAALAVINALIFESMHVLSGELEAMSDKSRQLADAARKRRISLAGHDGKRILLEATRKKFVGHALALRPSKPFRSDAVRATLRDFSDDLQAPKPRTLHEWLKAAGWTRDTPGSN